MTGLPAQPEPGYVPGMVRRLRAIGLSAARVHRDGRAEPLDGASPVERAWLSSGPMREAFAGRWEALVHDMGRPHEIVPGLALVPLSVDRAHRDGGTQDPPLTVAVLVGPELGEGDAFVMACSAAGVDPIEQTKRFDPERLVPVASRGRLAAAADALALDAFELDRRDQDLASLSGELSYSYEELSLLYKLSSGMTVNRPPNDFLNEACAELRLVSATKWTGLVLADDEPRLGELAGRVLVAGRPRASAAALRDAGQALMDRIGASTEPLIFNDTASLDEVGLRALADRMLVVPLAGQGLPLGLLLAGDKLDGSVLTSIDSKLCDSLASTLTIFLRNTILFADSQSMFMGTLRALTAAIDAKDSYTHGHSARVALVARKLAEACGVDEATRERVYLSGLVHDVGKIGVPEAVLTKPGKLTRLEFEHIKLHPEIGVRILQDIRQMSDLVPGVLYHHERWDGRGYPHGLSGRDTPLFGRLIGLADAFDAMSSTRTYRRSLSRAQVMDEVRRCSGTQFDPELAAVFVGLDFSDFDDMITRHQRLEAGGPRPAFDEEAA